MMEKTLLKNGWVENEMNPFKEKVVEKAISFYTFSNSHNTGIGFLFFAETSRIVIRLHSLNGTELNFFDIKTDNIDKAVEKLVSIQNITDIKNYFSFYMDMQSVCEISILAWEQWESNYR